MSQGGVEREKLEQVISRLDVYRGVLKQRILSKEDEIRGLIKARLGLTDNKAVKTEARDCNRGGGPHQQTAQCNSILQGPRSTPYLSQEKKGDRNRVGQTEGQRRLNVAVGSSHLSAPRRNSDGPLDDVATSIEKWMKAVAKPPSTASLPESDLPLFSPPPSPAIDESLLLSPIPTAPSSFEESWEAMSVFEDLLTDSILQEKEDTPSEGGQEKSISFATSALSVHSARSGSIQPIPTTPRESPKEPTVLLVGRRVRFSCRNPKVTAVPVGSPLFPEGVETEVEEKKQGTGRKQVDTLPHGSTPATPIVVSNDGKGTRDSCSSQLQQDVSSLLCTLGGLRASLLSSRHPASASTELPGQVTGTFGCPASGNIGTSSPAEHQTQEKAGRSDHGGHHCDAATPHRNISAASDSPVLHGKRSVSPIFLQRKRRCVEGAVPTPPPPTKVHPPRAGHSLASSPRYDAKPKSALKHSSEDANLQNPPSSNIARAAVPEKRVPRVRFRDIQTTTLSSCFAALPSSAPTVGPATTNLLFQQEGACTGIVLACGPTLYFDDT